MALCCERAARMQRRAHAVARSAIDPEFARNARHDMSDPSRVATRFRRFARRVPRQDPGCLD